MKFRKKPVVVNAVQWTGENIVEVVDFLDGDYGGVRGDWVLIETGKGLLGCPVGHWLVPGVCGRHDACEPEIFEATYEAVDDEVPA